MNTKVQPNDIVILYKSRLVKYVLYPTTKNPQLNITHAQLINHPYNTKYKTIYILKPTPSLLIETAHKQTQILYEADISLILHFLHNTTLVLESGTGSGTLTRFFKGEVHTYEKDIKRYEKLKEEFKLIGYKNIKLFNGDIREVEFSSFYDGVFLDIPDPEKVIGKVYDWMVDNGRICVFVPGVEQILKVRDVMENKYEIFIVENVKRDFVKVKEGVVNNRNQYSHTGFLIFGTKK